MVIATFSSRDDPAKAPEATASLRPTALDTKKIRTGALGDCRCGSNRRPGESRGGRQNAEVVEAESRAATEPECSADHSVSQAQAICSAESYLAFTAFPRTGLIEQLKFEGFSGDDATCGAENVTVAWMEQAALSAEGYLDFTSFSRSGLIN